VARKHTRQDRAGAEEWTSHINLDVAPPLLRIDLPDLAQSSSLRGIVHQQIHRSKSAFGAFHRRVNGSTRANIGRHGRRAPTRCHNAFDSVVELVLGSGHDRYRRASCCQVSRNHRPEAPTPAGYQRYLSSEIETSFVGTIHIFVHRCSFRQLDHALLFANLASSNRCVQPGPRQGE
jgi:hypothetical protein